MTDSSVARIVITGGPGSGKTIFFEKLKQDVAFSGFLFFDELARQILTENPQIRHDQTAFHREIYNRQVARETAAGKRSFVTDRGTVDTFAFHPETVTEVNTTLEQEYKRYTGVIQLGSAAGLGHAFYCRDEIRQETVAEALQIEAAIRSVWGQHPNYTFLSARQDIEEKYDQFKQLIVSYTVA